MGMLAFPIEIPPQYERQGGMVRESLRDSDTASGPTTGRRRRQRTSATMANQSAGPSNAYDTTNHPMNGLDGPAEGQMSQSSSGSTHRKSSIGTTGNKSSLQLGSTSSDGNNPLMPASSSSTTMSTSSTGRSRALSRSQIPQTSSSSEVEPKKQPGSELVEIYEKKHHLIPDAPYPLYYDSVLYDLCALFFFSCNFVTNYAYSERWDHIYFQNMKKSVSFVTFPEGNHPTNVLDLGCGVSSSTRVLP